MITIFGVIEYFVLVWVIEGESVDNMILDLSLMIKYMYTLSIWSNVGCVLLPCLVN